MYYTIYYIWYAHSLVLHKFIVDRLTLITGLILAGRKPRISPVSYTSKTFRDLDKNPMVHNQ